MIVSNHAVNKQYNRFLNITPCELTHQLHIFHPLNTCMGESNVFHLSSDDENRIRLKPLNDVPDCRHDYINASYIDVSCVCFHTTDNDPIVLERSPFSSLTHVCISLIMTLTLLSSLPQGYYIQKKFVSTQGKLSLLTVYRLLLLLSDVCK